MPSIHQVLIACETAYSRCFSCVFEDAQRLRFRNPDIPDMYVHNYTYIKQSAADAAEEILRQEQAFCEAESLGFCKVSADFPLPDTLHGAELETLGYYIYTGRDNRVPTPACTIQKASSLAMVDALYRMDVAADGARLGEDFCRRRAYGRGKVYLQLGLVDSYLCFLGNRVIGSCDLFIADSTAKIEDFGVVPAMRGKGYGTALLYRLIDIAAENGASVIYLTTDEDDTAKDMYLKRGFEKVGEKYAVLLRTEPVIQDDF